MLITKTPEVLQVRSGIERHWFDFSHKGVITESSNLVSSVVNKAGGQSFTASGSARPTTNTRTINGLNAIDFDGANNFLTADNIAAMFSGSDKPFSVFSVCQCDAPTSGNQNSIWAAGINNSSTPFHSQVYQNSNNIANRRDDTGTIATSGAAYVAGVNVNALVFTGTTTSSYTNTTTNYSGTSQDVGVITVNKFAVGATIRNTNTHFFDGIIGEIIIFAAALNADERQIIMKYLGRKWGVAVA